MVKRKCKKNPARKSPSENNTLSVVEPPFCYAGLTILQQRFCEILFSMEEPNQKQALIQAGSKMRGTSAEVYASRLLRNVKVQKYLNYLRKKSSDGAIIDKTKVLNELCKLAFTNIKNYIEIDEDGVIKFIPFNKIDVTKLAAIESIKVKENITHSKKGTEYIQRTTQFKLYNKDSALDKLMKHLGLYEKDNDQRKNTIQLALIDIIAHLGGIAE